MQTDRTNRDLENLRSLRTRHSQPQLITKLIEQTKSYQDGTGNPAMLPKLMARPLRQLQARETAGLTNENRR
jgi:hypothetical protein